VSQKTERRIDLQTIIVCEKCGRQTQEDEAYEHLGRKYCEDCYMDVLSPSKACDPWAVYVAQRSLAGSDKFSTLNAKQRRIVEYVRTKGEVAANDLTEDLNMTEAEFRREFAVVRHMEILKGKKNGAVVVYTLFDA
jgi:hypothetical protein